jgi:hypothetical protein
VLALATNAMNVSDQNYGGHPLFVFTTRGVWTLNVGTGDVVYASVSSPTSEETPVSASVCETPYGVAFVSQRGLFLISGGGVEFLSPQLEQETETPVFELPPETVDVIHALPSVSFRAFLPGIKSMPYNPHEAEILLVHKEQPYMYVYSLPGRMFYRSTETVGTVIKNAWPNLYATTGIPEDVGGGSWHVKWKDWSASEDAGIVHCGFLLRPLSFGTPDIKKLDRMILRGLLYGVSGPSPNKSPLFMLHHSDDAHAFTLSRGRLLHTAGNYRDVDTGLLVRAKFRWFTFGFGSVLHENSRLHVLESMVTKEYMNDKMR